jgi:isochorismate pyruvate lyase
MIDPEQCTTMVEVRSAIDELDAQIIALLGKRFRFVEAAARIKHSPAEVRDESRIAEVLDRVRGLARDAAVQEDLVAHFYEEMIEAAIAIEFAHFKKEK